MFEEFARLVLAKKRMERRALNKKTVLSPEEKLSLNQLNIEIQLLFNIRLAVTDVDPKELLSQMSRCYSEGFHALEFPTHHHATPIDMVHK